MRIKELFTVPEGQKVTEKALTKVLISSICSIFLCMACLFGTTWAWFTVSIENTGNVIQIGTADVKVTINNELEQFVSGTALPEGKNRIEIENSNHSDDFDKKATLYVTLTFGDEVAGYVILNEENEYKVVLEGDLGTSVAFSWIASWFPPDGTDPLMDEILWLEEETTGADDFTEGSVPTTEPAEESTGSTAATEETTENTQSPTETTAPTIIPAETSDPTTEPTTVPPSTEPATAPTETTAPATIPTETTEPVTEAGTTSTDATEEAEATGP